MLSGIKAAIRLALGCGLLVSCVAVFARAGDRSSGPLARHGDRASGDDDALVVASATDAYPLSFTDAKGHIRGFSVDVLDAVARAMNMRIRRVVLPNRELHSNFVAGDYDIMECFAESPSRANTCDFSVPYNTLEGTVFVRRDLLNVAKLEDLEGKIFAFPGRGTVGEDFIVGLKLKCRYARASSSGDALRLIEDGKADATLGARLTVLPLIEHAGLKNIRSLDIPVVGFDVRHCFGVHKGEAALLAKLNEGLAIIHRTGEFERIHRAWYARYEPAVFTREQVYRYAAAALLVGLIVAVWAFLKQRAQDTRIARQAAELRVMNIGLQQATYAKTDFIRTVSHELRNPLAGARMMSDILVNGSADVRTRDQVTKLRSCVQYLQAVLDETVDVAQIELGQVPTRLVSFRPRTLISESLSMFEPIAAEKGLKFQLEPSAHADHWYQGAALHLQRILINFLSNALKFTEHGGVSVSVEQVSHSGQTAVLRFYVTDTGCGVPAVLKPKIFSSYVRSREPQLDGSARGAGLGLAVCKRLAELNGGRVGFTSSETEGSRFWVELPLICADHATGEAGVPGRADFAGVRTLLVDDDSLQRETLSMLLQELGVVPELAESPARALELLHTRPFDLVIADYNLNTGTGIDLLERARQNMPDQGQIPVFHLVTSFHTDTLREFAVRSGFAGVHRKPLSFAVLFEILSSAANAGLKK